MTKYKQFIFSDWHFDRRSKQLVLRYSYDHILNFEEVYTFNFALAEYSQDVLERAVNTLHVVAGVSYYKSFLAPELSIENQKLDNMHAQFYKTVYEKGLGEFFYVNGLDPRTEISFPVEAENMQSMQHSGDGALVGVGGGKDSLVSIELLRDVLPVTTFSMGHVEKLEPLVQRIGLPHLQIDRKWDQQLIELNQNGAYNGHVPFSAILACVATVAAVLSGKRDVVVSNEKSADEPTLYYQGVAINHQYSKSSEFEKNFQKILKVDFDDTLRYYSLLRPLSELYIAEIFAKLAFNSYSDVFSSCNKAFAQTGSQLYWCGVCPKCCFVFLMLTPYVDRNVLEAAIGSNPLLAPENNILYKQLLGIDGDKPLECVGEIQESRYAMQLAQAIYLELNQYTFELDDYDYQARAKHSLPIEIETILNTQLGYWHIKK